ncbi:unnamed protein product [Rotaria magnacalcarata]|uniref:Prolyl endopeptidase n=1 Tax=Rotaria magnacalcarata TaxID=392030 RepID=A0A815JBH6_9BILA|nr:unnamed protein product [Rotaria magnacalcarata]
MHQSRGNNYRSPSGNRVEDENLKEMSEDLRKICTRDDDSKCAPLLKKKFGNPDIREEFKWAKLISPLYNIPTNPKTYPAILVTTTDHDDGVVPAHSFISIYISQIQYQLGEITNRRGRPLIVRIDVRVGYS